MSQPAVNQYCPHKLNPKACWHCYQQATAAPKAAPTQVGPRFMGTPNTMVHPSHGLVPAPTNVVPAPRGPQAHNPVAKPKPAPLKTAMADDSAPPPGDMRTKVYERIAQPWETDANGLERPPARPQLIDMVPKHPNPRPLGQ